MAVVLTACLIAALILLLAVAALRREERPVADRDERWVPPGWVSPTSPPPAHP